MIVEYLYGSINEYVFTGNNDYIGLMDNFNYELEIEVKQLDKPSGSRFKATLCSNADIENSDINNSSSTSAIITTVVVVVVFAAIMFGLWYFYYKPRQVNNQNKNTIIASDSTH